MTIAKYFLMMCAALLMVGCASEVSDARQPADSKPRILLWQLDNATQDEFAAKAVSETVGTIILNKGIPYRAATPSAKSPGAELSGSSWDEIKSKAEELHLPYVLTGTVQEYRYQLDMNGDPTVGITLRLLEVKTGNVIWQSSGSDVGIGASSLSSVSQDVVKKIVARMPWPLQ